MEFGQEDREDETASEMQKRNLEHSWRVNQLQAEENDKARRVDIWMFLLSRLAWLIALAMVLYEVQRLADKILASPLVTK